MYGGKRILGGKVGGIGVRGGFGGVKEEWWGVYGERVGEGCRFWSGGC